MDYPRQREKMVLQQLENRGIKDPRVLNAMAGIPREEFVPEHLLGSAYEDRALPIDQRQTISQPYTVAFMCEALRIRPEDRVLEVGTGSGYGAAVLSRLAAHVDTIERIPELTAAARARLARLGIKNVDVHFGDGSRGLPDQAPFDAICVTAGAITLPNCYLEQLAEGGRLLIPIGEEHGHQEMTRFTRRNQDFTREALGTFAFVPLVGDL
jgi:protein-L-isoaspartate(D-aspartate) O-methyltransferase